MGLPLYTPAQLVGAFFLVPVNLLFQVKVMTLVEGTAQFLGRSDLAPGCYVVQ
jgi:hypothetical protein